MIPFLDLKAINLQYREELIEVANKVIDSGWYVLGSETERFEEEFASYCGTQLAVGVGNGLDALTLVLKGWGIGPGDQVIVPANTFIATWLAVSSVGAEIVPVEPYIDGFNIDPTKIEDKINHKTRAIIPVHLYGELCDMDAILNIANLNNLYLLEDAAQAHGALQNGKRSGSWGHAAAFSFYPGKNLGAIGDGGAITTSSNELGERLKKIRNYGSSQKYIHEFQGVNSRLDELQAAFLRIKLRHLDRDNKVRRAIAKRYNEGIEQGNGITLPKFKEDESHVWHLYVIQHEKRDKLKEELEKNGINCGVHYPVPPYLQAAYKYLDLKHGEYLRTEKLHQTVLSLPISPVMTHDEVSRVIEVINKIARHMS
jgi:dTDP-4-amino-4,6-dideoxygalactose transaminase